MPETNGGPKIGVYVCDCGINIAGKVDVPATVEFAKDLPFVTVTREYKFMCSDPGQNLISEDLRSGLVNRVVVASCSPLMHEETFRRATEQGGENEFYFQMANIREHVSWVTEDNEAATQKAKALIAAAVKRVAHHQALERRKSPVHPDVMVVGAGIAGIHSALTIANSGKKVYLVEREPTIGGHMAKFDKTFPTLDCSACILTPKMVAVSQHPNIELLTNAEVEQVSGYVGNFTATVLKKARFIDEDKCSGCGECVEVCPVTALSEFENGRAARKMVYRSFPQSVPNTYIIDKKGRAPCRAACPAGVHAQGYIKLVSEKRYQDAFDLLMEDIPLPSVCGRVCYHPCEDSCERSKVDEPVAINSIKRFVSDQVMNSDNTVEQIPITHDERVAVIGSGPAGLACANSIVRKGYRVTVFEAAEKCGGMLRYGIPAYRLPEKILDKELDRLKQLGIGFRTSSKVKSTEQLKEEGFKAVFAATGAPSARKLQVPGEELSGVTDMLAFLKDVKVGKIKHLSGTVMVIGGGNSAMDVARTAVRLGADKVVVLYRRTRSEMPAHDWEIREAEEENVQFEFLSNPVAINGENGTITEIECIKMKLGEPDSSGRPRPVPVEGSNYKVKVDMVIPATGQESNPDLLVRGIETSKWGDYQVDPVTLETNLPGVFCGGDAVTGAATVVDAFGAGKRAAESIDRFLCGLDIREGREAEPKTAPEPEISGIEIAKRTTEKEINPSERKGSFIEILSTLSEAEAIAEANRCLECGGCCECLQCEKVCGDREAVLHDQLDEHVDYEVGTIILATGFKTFDASKIHRYGYGRLPNVYTSLEIERMINPTGPTEGHLQLEDGSVPKSVGIVHCVGSRDENHNKYCSKVCCMYSLKLAHLVHEHTGAEIYNFYIDMRTAGKGYDEFYDRLLEEGTHFIRGRVATISDWAMSEEEEGRLVIRAEDTLIGTVRRVPVDMVILAVGLEPQEDAEEIRRKFNISCSSDGWFLERHPKLAPVSTFTDGVFLAGACQGPKDIPDSVAQAGAAAAEAMALVDRGYVELEPNTAFIVEENCSGCKTCIGLCPFTALIYKDEADERGFTEVNEALCKGCGTCVAACPSGAIQQHLFTDDQIFEEIHGVLNYV